MTKHNSIYVFPITLLFVVLGVTPMSVGADEIRDITFPVNGTYTFRNDFHEPRGGGTRLHQGNDIIAEKMTPLVACVDGYISFVARPQVSWGYEVEIQGNDGYFYDYLHVNNDTPGTDDGMGGEANAYPAGVQRGATVSRGQLIGWVGDSGNAEETVPHLHFEIHGPDRATINPFESLRAASGGKGFSSSAPSTNAVDSLERERVMNLRYIFTKDLRVEAESNEVRQLQRVLKTLGYFDHPSATGYFGPVTEASVRKFQTAKNIRVSGQVDLETRRKLNEALGTYDPNDYQPFFTPAEERALQIARLLKKIAELQAILKMMQGG